MPEPTTDTATLLEALRREGPLSAVELAARLGVSQPTLSRRLARLGAEVAVLGRGRTTRYALPRPILGLPATQVLHWVNSDGRADDWGELTMLASGRLHTRGPGVDTLTDGLPWFLSPLRSEGFLGRLLGERLAAHGLGGDPYRWTVEQVLFAALQVHDAPGAFQLAQSDGGASLRLREDKDFDAAAGNVAATLPAGSSAGGEQAKFVGRLADGEAVLVKFSPPLGTPFGTRWSDLLHAEHLALQTLAQHGVEVTASRVLRTAVRSYLVSHRFDRIGTAGRRHAVALAAWHQAFVGGPLQNWSATCAVLARQRRVPAETPDQARALLQFGRLIGNTDMHFGNLSLWLEREDIAAGRGRLAPVYDMLPMRWRPDAASGALDLLPFTPDDTDLSSPARSIALGFWRSVADEKSISPPFRALAEQMLERVRG